ncbi:cupin domain-containing protein [Burkholderia sp. Bp9090]|uniref:cupin domain-containing protein n=1 Tax=Burkholderia sp. Bp9090 TaxID=2184567 RepID=UPI001C8ADB71|nr:cupin domain-containing protein [Burkholderia sp. Bp9090]
MSHQSKIPCVMIHFPISKEEFFQNFFEKKPALFRGAASGKKFDWLDVDESIYASQSSPLKIKMHSGSSFLEPENYEWKCLEVGVLKSQLNSTEIHRQLDNGSTLVFNRIESPSLKIRKLCQHISDFLAMTVVANGYLSFGRRGSFGDHWDTHDVFAVQLIGRKKWKIYNPTFKLPIEGQTSKDQKHLRPIRPELDFILEEGDIVYIPRGWWHSATALDEPTFHIAAGIHTNKYLDYIDWITKRKLKNRDFLRTSLPFHDIKDLNIEQMIEDINQEIRSPQNFLEYIEDVNSETVSASDIGITEYVKKFSNKK